MQEKALINKQWVQVTNQVETDSRFFKAGLDQLNSNGLILKKLSLKSVSTMPETFELLVYAIDQTPHRLEVSLAPQNQQVGDSGLQSLTLLVQNQNSLDVLADLLAVIRKSQHLEICRNQDVEAIGRKNGFEVMEFIPKSLPELNFEDVDTTVRFLDRQFALPFFITGMTGGIQKAAKINRLLADLANEFDIPLGLGSQRLALENSDYEEIFRVKDKCPNIFLIGNIGIAQIRDANYLQHCTRAVQMIEANALAIHINIVQELIQVEGDRHFSGLLDRIAMVVSHLNVPVIVKEVGAGMDIETALQLEKAGVAALDVGGRGGTSWAYIEGLRSSSEETTQISNTFRNWGIPTANALAGLLESGVKLPLLATGGMRDGTTIGKACALGASMVGIGLPILRAVSESYEKGVDLLSRYQKELKITMTATGANQVSKLAHRLSYNDPYKDLLEQRVRRGSLNAT